MEHSALIERFLRYVQIDTQSDEESGRISPSTDRQRDLAGLLVRELKGFGLEHVVYDEEHCYVYAYLPGRPDAEEAAGKAEKNGRTGEGALGFIAHMDTSPAVSGAGVKPRIIRNYNGHDELLKPEEFPDLGRHMGEDLIASDGSTLLGADDKAGVAEIMHMLEYFTSHPEVPHRPVWAAFTPDEEIGAGTAAFDLEQFPAPAAYTVDGGAFGIVEYECFNAAQAVITFHGRSVHPGSAKGLMINAMQVAMDFHQMLPVYERPENTEQYEGFYMLEKMSGSVEEAQLTYIIRDHDKGLFDSRKERLQIAAAQLNAAYEAEIVEVSLKDQYYNMADGMKDHMDLIDDAFAAIRTLGGDPQSLPIRGGTDGAVLTWKGLPCPNLCTGGYNYHSRYEYASIQEMEKCAQLLILLAQGPAGKYAEQQEKDGKNGEI